MLGTNPSSLFPFVIMKVSEMKLNKDNHSQFHSPNAFCGSAGSYEMQHLTFLVDKLSDEELKLLVEKVGIKFEVDEKLLTREDYEGVIDEADREDFYREYEKILKARN